MHPLMVRWYQLFSFLFFSSSLSVLRAFITLKTQLSVVIGDFSDARKDNEEID
jgi:hypothetical protein